MDWQELQEAVINGQAEKVKQLTEAAIKAGEQPQTILQKGLIPAMAEVGERMKNQIFYVPEVLVAARAMKFGLNVLRPLLAESGAQPLAKMVLGTVKGDLHDIGKNLVGMMMEGAGFQVIDLGTDVSPQKFVEAVRQHGANMVGMSALLTTTMPAMRATIEALKEAGLRDQVKVMVGGAPVTQRYADEIGADGFAPDASWAVDKARQLLGVKVG